MVGISPSKFVSHTVRNGVAEARHEGLIRWKIARRPGINNQNVLMEHVVGAYRTDTVVSLTTKPVMFLGVLKTAVGQELRTEKKRGGTVLSLSVSFQLL